MSAGVIVCAVVKETLASAVKVGTEMSFGDNLSVVAYSEVMDMGGWAASRRSGRARRLFGIRRQPGRLALAVFRLPLPAYRHGWGWLLGHTFLVLIHAGRKTGKPYSTVAMVLRYDPGTREAVVFSAWGQNTDWIRNIRVRPASRVQIGRESFTPRQRFLTEDESLAVVAEFRRRHPWRLRLATWVMGWPDLRSDAAARDFVSPRPFVAFRPADASRP